MPILTTETIQTWERFYRANFINSLTGFKSLSLIGTVNATGQTNLGLFSSIVHIGSNPALVGYINRPIEAAPHTLANIQATGSYTINHVDPSFLEAAHQTSAKYPHDVSEFEQVGLKAEFIADSKAPFVKESLVKYDLILKEIIPIKWNETFLVIGEIQNVLIDNRNIIGDDGFISLDHVPSVCSNGIDGYYTAQFINRYEYAKPFITPKEKPRQ